MSVNGILCKLQKFFDVDSKTMNSLTILGISITIFGIWLLDKSRYTLALASALLFLLASIQLMLNSMVKPPKIKPKLKRLNKKLK